MTSEGFLAAFRRFTARRGSCSHLYSDNGTNFVGANKELIKMNRQFLQILSPDVRAQMENEGTSWSFIPPASPHFGGLWEAGVKSFKSKPHLTPDRCAHSPMILRTKVYSLLPISLLENLRILFQNHHYLILKPTDSTDGNISNKCSSTFGIDGTRNIYHAFNNVQSGPNPKETSKETT
ncbi:uncharacterized protein LOC129945819 [Eupeodes corollae]|uniref:uncharacterized protein LOC129945819 n=1 Tax=Eupeodes corollae TaxID=290404 RepID=UPI0024908454|nr:uncharacterized protein LOC129945819 [Eupeodes corollae]